MPAGAIKTFSFNVPVNNGELDDITVDDLIAIEGKGVKLFVDDIEIASITDDTDAFYGEDCYIKSNKYYYGTVTITKEGAVTIEETELEGK